MSTVPMCAVMHFEMPYKDADRAARFYAAAFGWTHQNLGPEMGDYLLVTTALPGERANMPPQAAPGAINGGLFPFKADWPMQHPSVVIDVDDIEAAMARVIAAGGEMLGGAHGHSGHWAICVLCGHRGQPQQHDGIAGVGPSPCPVESVDKRLAKNFSGGSHPCSKPSPC